MTTITEKSIGIEIFERAAKCCYSCQEQKEKMFPSYDNKLFICKECASVFNNATEEFKKHGETKLIKVVKRSVFDAFDFCNWHNDKVYLVGKLIVSFNSSEEPPKCCSDCMQKAANL